MRTKQQRHQPASGTIGMLAGRARSVAEGRKGGQERRIVIAVIGRDKPGILAGVTGVLARRQANILDVNQTIMSDLFTMVMLVDIAAVRGPFSRLKADLERYGQGAALSIIVQHEELFKAMHRI